MTHIKFKRLPHGEGLPLPEYQTAGAAGMDICAADSAVLRYGDVVAVRTGFAIEIPPGFEAQVRPRSGLTLKHQITVANSPGTIDCDYRGEVTVLLTYIGRADYGHMIERGDRVAQLVVAPVARLPVKEVDELSDTERGDGGFGSTGRV